MVREAINEYVTATGEYPNAVTVADLLAILSRPSLPRCAKALEALPKGAVTAAFDAILDGWGRPMRYSRDGGFGGGPVLISAGPDGKMETDADNIRSDK